jgi:hypothetical protein
MLAGVAASALFSSPAIAAGTRSFTIVLPGDYAGDPTALKNAIGRVSAAQAPGSTMTVVNAVTRTAVAREALPNEPRYANPNVKARFQGPAMRAVSQFIDGYATAHSAPSALPSQVGFPVAIDSIAANFIAPADDREVLVLGSARYDDPREPTFSMRHAVPGDGLIAASEAESPYGGANRRDLLKGVSVHLCVTERPTDWPSPMIEARTERAWSIFTSALGGRLSTYTQDVSACFDRLIEGKTESARHYELDKNDTRLEMVTPARERASLNPVSRPVVTGTIGRNTKRAASPGAPSASPQERAAGLAALPERIGRSVEPGRSAAVEPVGVDVKKKGPCRMIGSRSPPASSATPKPIDASGLNSFASIERFFADTAPGNYSPRRDSARSTVTPSITRRVARHALGEHAGGRERQTCLN